MREDTIAEIYQRKIIVIVRDIYGTEREELMHALWDGGIRLAEFTFDQRYPERWMQTCKNISDTIATWKGKLICGAGTVMESEQVRMAKEAGAQYIISPNTKESVIRETVKQGMVSIPGALSPTEVVEAVGYGADFVKIFPAAALGIDFFRAIRGPLNHIPFIAVGGISYENMGKFMEAGAVGVGIGGELVSKKQISEGAFDMITEIARHTVQALYGGIDG